ncbi:MAG: hypothetical protein COB20_16160 [SAR86 cluster bacterium]|uniref:Uncharacterized protein n=1 Tax=SAR86 cluster bacterium TaxID=2030880 RepID=A0A2A4WUD6_9GAMM|nr:MAG: hypothetical protein COB20_16160 [SAR86 cluster bacterium]
MASRCITIQCWRCGTTLRNLLLPFSRYEECSTCNADLHACISCKNYAPALSDSCSEDRAEFVQDNEKANFCDFFKVNPKPYNKKDGAAATAAKAGLAELFGEETEVDTEAGTSPTAEADKALAELKSLFGDE